MGGKFTGLIKIVGITGLLIGLWVFLAAYVPTTFLSSNNIENLMRRTALYGILGIGVAFVIMASGIDLSIGSLVCLAACLLGLFLKVDYVQTGMIPVWEIQADQKRLKIDANHDFKLGDYLWYDKDRRNRSLLKIERIEVATDAGSEKTWLSVSGELLRSFPSSGRPIATVCRAFPIESVNDREVVITGKVPSLKPRDKLLFVSPHAANRERAIEQVGNSAAPPLTLTLTEAAGIDSSFQAIPIVRKPLMSIPAAIASVMGISLLIGLIHGLLITRLNLQPFVVTLCGLMIYRGVARWLTSDQTVGFSEHSETIGTIGTGRWVLWSTAEGQSFGIPYSFFIFAAFVGLAVVLLNLTVWGRHLLAIGRNQEAARYSGINTRRVTLTTYLICSMLAGIGGMMFAIDSASIAPSAFGNFFELYAIAAAVLGGCSLRGGEGSIFGVVVGTALMQTLYNAIILLKIPDELEFSIIGTVILLGVIGDEFIHRAASAIKSRR